MSSLRSTFFYLFVWHIPVVFLSLKKNSARIIIQIDNPTTRKLHIKLGFNQCCHSQLTLRESLEAKLLALETVRYIRKYIHNLYSITTPLKSITMAFCNRIRPSVMNGKSLSIDLPWKMFRKTENRGVNSNSTCRWIYYK